VSDSGPSPVEDGRRQAAMPFILLTVLIDMVSIGIIVPVLPALIGTFSVSPSDQAYWVGVVSFAFGIANFFGAPLLGALSDAWGRRRVLLLGFCGLALNFFATALATSLWMLIAVRLVGGAMQANAAVANAYVADITAPEGRAKRFGMLGAMFGLGFIIGPAAGGLLGAIDIHLPFFVAGGLSLLNLAYGWWVLPESLPPEKRRPFEWNAANPLKAFKALVGLPGIGKVVGVIACTGLAQGVLYNVWVLHNTFKFGWDTQANGWSLAAVGVVSVVVQGFLLGKLLKRFPPRRLVVMGLISSTLAFFLWGAASQGWMMYAVIFANLLGFTVTASVQSLVSSAADARTQGQTMGSVSSLNSLTAVVAPVLASPALMAVSHLPQGDWRIGAPLYLGAVLHFAALLLAWLHFRSTR
jgi:DHA1 family tetracycline resistance protein-like MFS transporter